MDLNTEGPKPVIDKNDFHMESCWPTILYITQLLYSYLPLTNQVNNVVD